MWRKLPRKLVDPVVYRKYGRHLVRPVFPPRAPLGLELGDFLPSPDGGALLVVIAHPDDEIFASGLILEALRAGVAVEIVCLTRGEGGVAGEVPRGELGQAREAELRASAAALGVPRVTFLGHVDPLCVDDRLLAPLVGKRALAGQLGELFADRRPGALVTHGSSGEYWHRAHLLLRAAVMRAAAGKWPVATLQAWQEGHPLAALLNRDDPADLVIDASPWRETRQESLLAHRTQADYFARLGGGSLDGFIDRIAREGYRVYPVS